MTEAKLAAIDRSIPFVDAHLHLWELGRLRYPWLTEGSGTHNSFLGEYKAIRVDWGPDRMAREFHGQTVVGAVHVEGACDPTQAVDETRWLDAVAAQRGWPDALVVFCDLTRPDAPAILESHLEASTRTRGVRARPEEPAGARFRRGLRAAAELGLSYEFSASPGGLTHGLELAQLEGGIQIIVGHTGMPMRWGDDYQALWRREMRALAEAPNIAVKISGLGMTDHAWTLDSIRPWVLETLEIFGIDRCIFGTNWPVDSLYSPYMELVDAYRRVIAEAGLTVDEQHAVLHRTAQRLYRFGDR